MAISWLVAFITMMAAGPMGPAIFLDVSCFFWFSVAVVVIVGGNMSGGGIPVVDLGF